MFGYHIHAAIVLSRIWYYLPSYLDTVLERFDLLQVLSIGAVGVVKGSFKFPDVCLVLLLDAVDLGLVAGLNLHKSTLEFFNGTGAALSAK